MFYNYCVGTPLLNIPVSGRCGEYVEGYCASNNTNRMWIKVSGFNKTVIFYPNSNISHNIGPINVSHSHRSLKVHMKFVFGPEVDGRTILCRDTYGGLCVYS